eukprot:jgi/Botrbrau1/10727/Bobra.357_1s0028.1
MRTLMSGSGSRIPSYSSHLTPVAYLHHLRQARHGGYPPRWLLEVKQEERGRLHASELSAKGTSAPAAPGAQEEEEYDVYTNLPMPLEEGEEKHTISVFVADEAGLINRVAGVFARRGANIESLAVGLNIDKALFTIVVTGTPRNVANLVKQIAKLVKVRYVEDITRADRIERELVLLKISAAAGPDRTEVMQIADIFRARVVDVSERSITLCVTGDPGKCTAMQRALGKFTVKEVARTGRISLKRGDALLEMGGWGDGFRNNPPRERPAPAKDQPVPLESVDGDVYMVDKAAHGVWEVENVLEATYHRTGSSEDEPHTLSIEVEDVPGVLNQVTGVFARRGFNVQSLAVGPSERPGQSRITMVIPGGPEGTSKLIKQLNKLVYVQKVTDLSPFPFISRELMLIKVSCTADQRRQLSDLANIFRGTVCDVSLNTVTLEIQGKEDKMFALQQLLQPYGILEIARTGRVALARDSGVDSRYLERLKSTNRVML